jgi:hypothetical protein
MRNVILMLLLAASSGSALAKWVKVADDDRATFYADPAKTRKSGHFVKMWVLMDFKAPQSTRTGEKYSSTRLRGEYDCKEEQFRIIDFSNHSGDMASGETISSDSSMGKWTAIPPESFNEDMLNVACGKVKLK